MALALCVAWTLCGPAFAASPSGAVSLPGPQPTAHTAPQSAGPMAASASVEGTGDPSGAADYPALSTLAALGIGIVGLLWVRRHTAEL